MHDRTQQVPEGQVHEGQVREEQVHPLDEPTRAIQREEVEQELEATRRKRGLGANRHLGSIVVSFAGVLGAYGAVDYGYYRSLGDGLTAYQGGELADKAMIAFAVAAGCLFVAALAGRISGLGPLVAGLVLGGGPAAWMVLDRSSFVARANDIPEFWDHASFGLVGAGPVLYPVVCGLLLGCAFAGRWRRRPAA